MSPAIAKRILVVDDEPQILDFLRDLFRGGGWEVDCADTGTAGIEKLEHGRYDVILTDLKMPGADGIELLRMAKNLRLDAEVVLMTGYGTVDSAIEAMRAGAFHYLTKPFKAEEVLNLVEKAHAQRQLRRENLFLKAASRGEHQIQAIVGAGAAAQEIAGAIRRLADVDTPVLLSGEKGTGRAFFARIIHYQSARSAALFVPVYCAGATEETLTSDLFGHAPGAYARAVLPRVGKVEMANHGTVFLAEIGEVPLAVQERLLRLLQAKTISPVESDRDVEVDVRVAASSAANLDDAVAKGRFLAGLRDLLAPGTIVVPPLRERADDIPLLLHHFLYEANRNRRKPLRGFSEAAVSALTAYAWPGNTRELRELVRSISARKKQGSVVDAADLPTEILYGRRRQRAEAGAAGHAAPAIHDAIGDLERPMVLQALALAEWDRERAAALLNIGTDALEDLMKRHGIEP
ncbi:MAG: sigma-54-dependent transcriptional regulator [Gemmatimonadota bacterium]